MQRTILMLFIFYPIALYAQSPFNPVGILNTNATSDLGYDRSPDISSDGNTIWIAVWYSDENLTPGVGTDNDIFISKSTDNGSSWTPPSILNSNALGDTGGDTFPQIVTDQNGIWIVVWTSEDTLGNTIGNDSDILFTFSSDNGETWATTKPLNTNAIFDEGDDLRPTLATDNHGTWICVWHSNDSQNNTFGTDFDIFFSRSSDNGTTWSSPTAIHANAQTDTGMDSEAVIATNKQGVWIVAWSSVDTLGNTIGPDRDILYVRSVDNGLTWSTPSPIHSNAFSDSGADTTPHIACDTDGNWLVVWRSTDTLNGTIGPDADILFVRSRDNGITWSPPRALNANATSDTATDSSPHIGIGSNRHWIVVWSSTDSMQGTIGVDTDILVCWSLDFGTSWTQPFVVNSNAYNDIGNDRFPRISSNSHGQWIIVWQTDDTLNQTIGDELDILFASMTDQDTDGIPDLFETNSGVFSNIADTGSSPILWDTDNDGLPDGWEAIYGLDPNDNGDVNPVFGALGDPDGDGIVNIDEYRGASNPWHPDSPNVDSFSTFWIIFIVTFILLTGLILLKNSHHFISNP